MREENNIVCRYSKKCGACRMINVPYEEQLKKKQSESESLLGKFCRVGRIVGAEDSFYYRNKVHAVVERKKIKCSDGKFRYRVVAGTYKEGTHDVIPIENCMIEDKVCSTVVRTVRELIESFKLKTYDEDLRTGLIRHILVRRAVATGEVMLVLVLAGNEMPGKANFVKALRARHPEISTMIININKQKTNMVLGEHNHIVFGKGYITDILCGNKFRISPDSFYQINPVQTEKLYRKAIGFAEFKGNETVIDAYCGIGTIGITAASKVKKVIGIELNKNAVRDARINSSANGIKNIDLICDDATRFMQKMAAKGERADVVILDPPRAGTTYEFICAVSAVGARKVVYISCNPETQARDLKMFKKKGYDVKKIQPVDMFPHTGHVETVVLMSKKDT
ncbi:MAG: 23S rRNA (uracil(1939)-C(5))-methyltransferase RlmD [Lachnospiraceae bacterium]|jgi:23S rRNA (uracil1939-C5)-methyltransferase